VDVPQIEVARLALMFHSSHCVPRRQ
jgi:hypothetical protein